MSNKSESQTMINDKFVGSTEEKARRCRIGEGTFREEVGI
jgi:hypothetical protein